MEKNILTCKRLAQQALVSRDTQQKPSYIFISVFIDCCWLKCEESQCIANKIYKPARNQFSSNLSLK